MIRTYSDAVALIGPYDVVLDCTDSMESAVLPHPFSALTAFWRMRYVLGDACVHCGIPLVAGDALAWEGQLTVYNYNGMPFFVAMDIRLTEHRRAMFEMYLPESTRSSLRQKVQRRGRGLLNAFLL